MLSELDRLSCRCRPPAGRSCHGACRRRPRQRTLQSSQIAAKVSPLQEMTISCGMIPDSSRQRATFAYRSGRSCLRSISSFVKSSPGSVSIRHFSNNFPKLKPTSSTIISDQIFYYKYFEHLKRRRISERNDEFDASNPLQSCSICKGFEIHVPSASRFCIYASNETAFRASRVCMLMHSAMRATARR